jgi:sporulation protein YlmC with PRC-barrel domain
MKLSFDEVKGRTVIDATGAAIGEVDGLYVEQAAAGDQVCIGGMRVKLRASVADDVGVERGTFRSAIVEVPASMLQAIGDAVLLNVKLDALLQPQVPAEQPMPSP